MWVHALCIAFGAGIGALVRWQLALITPAPWGTLLANIIGGLLIGFVVALIEAWTMPLWTRSMLVTGFLGGLTTFSTFSLESIELIVAGRWGFAVMYVLMTMSLTLLACFVSYQAAVRIL